MLSWFRGGAGAEHIEPPPSDSDSNSDSNSDSDNGEDLAAGNNEDIAPVGDDNTFGFGDDHHAVNQGPANVELEIPAEVLLGIEADDKQESQLREVFGDEDKAARDNLVVCPPADPTLELQKSLVAGEKFYRQFLAGGKKTDPNADDQFADKDEATHAAAMETRIFPTLESGWNSTEYDAFIGKHYAWAQFKVQNSFYPPKSLKHWRGANIKFSVIDSSMRRCIKLVVTVENPKGGRDSKPHLRLELFWHFGGILKNFQNFTQIRNFKYTPVLKPGVPESSQPADNDIHAIDVEWQSDCPTVVGVTTFNPDHNWSADTVILVMALINLRDTCATVQLRIPHIVQDKTPNTIAEIKQLVRTEPDGLVPKDLVANPSFWHWFRKSGRAEVAFGNMLTADALEKRVPFNPVSVPATFFFTDIREAEAKLGYGVYYEYEFAQELLKALAVDEHKFAFIAMGDEQNSLQIVAINLNKTSLPPRCADNFHIQEGTILEASCKIDEVGAEPVEFQLFVMDNIFSINPGDADVIAVVKGRRIPPDGFKEVASTYPQPLKTKFDGRFEAKKNTAGIKRTLNAVHQLFGEIVRGRDAGTVVGKHARWWPLALNHSPPQNDELVQVIPDCDPIKLQEVIGDADKYLKHNEQKMPMQSVNGLRRRTALVAGPPGTGKTVVGVSIGVIYLRMEGHIIVVGPTNATADEDLRKLLQVLDAFNLRKVYQKKIVRLYRSHLEREETHKGSPLEEVDGSDDDPATDKGKGKATDAEPATDKGKGKATDNGKASDIDNGKNLDEDPEHEAIEIQVVLQLMRENRLKLFGFSEFSLARQMMERAISREDPPCMVTYTPKNEPEKEETIDFWQTLRDYIALLNKEDSGYYTWTPEDKARYAACCRHANAAVMKACLILVTTANNVGSEVVCQNFGVDAKFIVYIQDEASMVGEADTWIGITKLSAYDKVRAIWLIGDNAQLGPLILSGYGKINPFADQLELSLFSRLYLSNFGHFELILSGRMHRNLLYFPNHRTYRGKLRATGEANSRELPIKYPEWFKTFFNEKDADACRLFAVYVASDCAKNSITKSKFNLESAAYTCTMVNDMRINGASPMGEEDLVILTSYVQQRGLINSIFVHMAKKLGLRRNAFPSVYTIDGFQSRQSKIIIFDTVVTAELGFLDNEKRMNVACTRAMSVFIMIASMITRDLAKDIPDSMGGKKIDVDEFTKVSRRHTLVDGERFYHESPYLADYLQWLSRKRLAMEAPLEICWKAIQKTYGVPFNIPTDYVIPEERIAFPEVEATNDNPEATGDDGNAMGSTGGFPPASEVVDNAGTAIVNDPGNYEFNQPTQNLAAGEGSSKSAAQGDWAKAQGDWAKESFESTGKASPNW